VDWKQYEKHFPTNTCEIKKRLVVYQTLDHVKNPTITEKDMQPVNPVGKKTWLRVYQPFIEAWMHQHSQSEDNHLFHNNL
jgi:hypothetical protein